MSRRRTDPADLDFADHFTCGERATEAVYRISHRSLRLKVSAAQETLDLDLRKDHDLARSQFLYRLGLLRIPWGKVTETRGGRGTFREVWRLQWQPEFALAIIEAAPYGNTVVEAASALAQRRAREAHDLPALTGLVSQLLLADLPDIAVSTGSACTSAGGEPSHVLRAMGCNPARARGAVRFSLGRWTTAEEMDQVARTATAAVQRLRALAP